MRLQILKIKKEGVSEKPEPKRREGRNGIGSIMKLISKCSQYIIRTPRSVSEAICGHVVDVSINLGPIRFTNTERINIRVSERIRERTKVPHSGGVEPNR